MVQIQIGDDINTQSGLVYAVKTITGNLSLTSSNGPNSGHNYCIAVNTSSALTITLPSTSDNGLNNGRSYYIHSVVTSPNITIDGNGKNIIGNATIVLSGDYDSIRIIYNSDVGAWFII